MAEISIKDLRIVYGGGRGQGSTVAVEELSLQIGSGEFVTIVGPSGCGKSTMLSAIGGLVAVSGGRIEVDGRRVEAPGTDRAVVFQEFALLPWRTVRSNIEFGMQVQGWPRELRRERAEELIDTVNLRGFEDHYAYQLSGGMRQRVGIARALAVDPKILLMDEPFGALDAQTRELMGRELLALWEQERKTVVFVTHSLEEAIYLGDRVVLLSARPAQVRCALDVPLERPRSSDMQARPEFVRLRQQLWEILEGEVRAAMADERRRG